MSSTESTIEQPSIMKEEITRPYAKWVTLVFVVSVTVLAAGYAFKNFSGGDGGNGTSPQYVLAEFTEGPFRVQVKDNGNLDSQNNAILDCKIPGTTMIISIIPEGTSVEKGDVVCNLDSSEIEDKIKQQEIDVTSSEAAMLTSKENLDIQIIDNQRDLSAAEIAWKLAKLDLEKYENGEYRQQRNALLGQIKLKEEEVTRAEESLSFSKRMAVKGYRSQSDLEAEQLTLNKVELELAVEKEKLNVLEKYEYIRNIEELKATAKELELEFQRAKKKAEAALTKAKADYESRRLTYEIEKQKLYEYKSYLEYCVLTAPQSGEVVYANSTSSGYKSSGEVLIEEGKILRERQDIIKIPDLDLMMIQSRIHESAIGRVELGQPVIIRVNAFPDTTFNGVVASVSNVPLSGSWPNTDIKEYRVQINLTDEPEIVRQLRPGLSADFEIIVDNRESVPQIPIQSIVNIGKHFFVYKPNFDGFGERVEVEVGDINDSNVEIKSGLELGDKVIMNPRSAFADEIALLSEELGIEESKKQDEVAKNRAANGYTPSQNVEKDTFKKDNLKKKTSKKELGKGINKSKSNSGTSLSNKPVSRKPRK